MQNTLSSEQLAVVLTSRTHNVIVNSVAGCGKTTMALGICQENPKSNVLIVTYNSKLRLETRARSEKYKISNAEIHTYHSLCNKYYCHASTDAGILNACQGLMPMCQVPAFDIVILDEQQDLDFVCFRFIIKFIKDNCKNPRLVVLGDINQSIYGFKGSDYRFLTCARECFSTVTTYPWTTLTVSETFRVTAPTASFINNQLLCTNKLVSKKQGEQPKYILYNAFSCKIVVKKIMEYLSQRSYKPEDIFVLSFSIRSSNKKAPTNVIENLLVKEGYPCYVPLSDDQELSAESMAGKITFSSFHQAKGRERKVVILVGFDGKLIRWLVEERQSNRDSIINSFYVACTRGSEELFLLHHKDNELFPTLTVGSLRSDCSFINGSGVKADDVLTILEDKALTAVRFSTSTRPVTSLFRFISQIEIDKLMLYFTVIKTPLTDRINPRSVVAAGNLFEQVSDLYGSAVTVYNEREYTSSYKSIRTVISNVKRKDPVDQEAKDELAKLIESETASAEDIRRLIYLCNYREWLNSGYKSRFSQLKDYDWVDTDAIITSDKIINAAISSAEAVPLSSVYDKCKANRIAKYKKENPTSKIPDNAIRMYEMLMESKKFKRMSIVGYADIVTPSTIYEIKCTSETKPEHLFQLATYGCLDADDTRMILINVREGMQYEIIKFTDKNGFMNSVIDLNCRPEITTTYDEFMARVIAVINCQSETTQTGVTNPSNLAAAEEIVPPSCELVDNSDLLAKLRKLKK